MPIPRRSSRRARGFTLIEVLVSILIFSFGVLGAVGMQARILQSSTQNADRSRASMLANELASQMWLAKTVQVSDTAIAAWYTAWQARVQDPSVSGLPNASSSTVTTTVNGTPTAVITIKWRPTTMASTSTDNKFETTVVIP